jgi:hypothetical protein
MGSKRQPAHSPTTSSDVDTSITSPARPSCNESTGESSKRTFQAFVTSRKSDQTADSFLIFSQAQKANVIFHTESVVTVWSHLW